MGPGKCDEARGEITWVASPRSPERSPLCVCIAVSGTHQARVRHQAKSVSLPPLASLSPGMAWSGLCVWRRVRNNNLCRRLLCTVTPPLSSRTIGHDVPPWGGLREWCLLCNYMGSGWCKGGGLRSCWGVLCCVDGTVDERSGRWQY